MCTTVQAASAALPQGPSLRSGLCCPGPSSLIWSHAPHLQAQLDFTAMRLIRAAFAVPPISAPRRPRSRGVLSLAYFLDMSSSGTDGKFIRLPIPSSFTDDAGLRPEGKRSRHFQLPHPTILVGGSLFRGFTTVHFRCDLPICLLSCQSLLGFRPANEEFYFRASDGLITRSAAEY